MNDAFKILGLELSLSLDEETLRGAFREAGKRAHPDAGGADEEFSQLRDAFETLCSPSRRLKHWLELRGTPVDLRGSVDAGLMDLFSKVSGVSQSAETVIRRREASKSALGLALMERETQQSREAVEKMIQSVESAINRECGAFPEIESPIAADPELPSMTARNLAFLEKWRAGLRALFSRLV